MDGEEILYTGYMSPLDNPMVEAMYPDAEHAGLMAGSLIQAVLRHGVETFGEVKSVTPQSFHRDSPKERGWRVDVKVEDTAQKFVVKEFQLRFDPSMFQRGLMEAYQVFAKYIELGTKTGDIAEVMPQVVVINILDYPLPDTDGYYFQPIHIRFDRPPRNIAIPQFSVYNIVLPAVPNAAPDFSDPLYCWAYLYYAMHTDKKSPEEVFKMQAELKTYADTDDGMRQFCERFNYCASSPDVRRDYHNYQMSEMKYRGELRGAAMLGEQRGEQRGIEIGEQRGIYKMVFRMLKKTIPLSDIIDITSLSESDIRAYAAQHGLTVAE